MKSDPIVEEIHAIRDAIAKRFDNDLRAICDDARRRQASIKQRPVTLQSRAPIATTMPIQKAVG